MEKLEMKKLPILFCLLFLIGCSPLSQLKKDYKKVVYINGINRFEAITIAQMFLVKSIYRPYYPQIPAYVRDDEHAQQYSDYWFVDFSPELTFDAPSYLVVIHRQTGDVIYNGEYWPRKMLDLQWVFDRANK